MTGFEIRLFAALADRFDGRTVRVELPDGATGADLLAHLSGRQPEAAELLAACRVAVNRNFADPTAPLPVDAEIALIPPVSGG